MELRTVDPRTLKANPNNPRRAKSDKFSDAQMVASINASGLLQPPMVREDGDGLVILFGHRRVSACVKLKRKLRSLCSRWDRRGWKMCFAPRWLSERTAGFMCRPTLHSM